jgi:thiol-disulfide isomerase/thioredoxin
MNNPIVTEFYKVLADFNKIFKFIDNINLDTSLTKAHILHGKLILLEYKYKKSIIYEPNDNNLYILSTLNNLIASTNKLMDKYDPIATLQLGGRTNIIYGGAQTDLNITNNETILVLFYADWCFYCKKFMPIWDKLEKNLKIKTKKINCPENEELCNKYDIQGYPTIKLFKNNQEIDFDKERTYDGVMEFVKKNT